MAFFEDIDAFDDEEGIEAAAIDLVASNLRANKYIPLPAKYSQAIRAHYRKNVTIPLDGQEGVCFYSLSGTLVATGYTRVVIGDYGAYVEFESRQINHAVIMNKFPGEPSRPVKYIWKIVSYPMPKGRGLPLAPFLPCGAREKSLRQ